MRVKAWTTSISREPKTVNVGDREDAECEKMQSARSEARNATHDRTREQTQTQ